MAYRNLVVHSSEIFRSDVEFKEKPRQVVFGGILCSLLVYLSYRSSERSYDISSVASYTAMALLLTVVIYSVLQSKDGLMVREFPICIHERFPDPTAPNDMESNSRSRSLLFHRSRRYHWYVQFFHNRTHIRVLVLPCSLGIPAVHQVLGDPVPSSITQPSHSIISFDHLDCSINFSTVYRQLTSIWYVTL
jgi:hypothetical protein